MDDNIKLFKADSNDVTLPTLNTEMMADEYTELMQGMSDIKEAISGDIVKKLIIPEDSDIEESNIIIDVSNIDSITVFQKEVIISLLKETGDTAVYLYKKNGMAKIGYSEKFHIEKIIPLIKDNVFDNNVIVYKDYKKGEPVKEIKATDITMLRLNL